MTSAKMPRYAPLMGNDALLGRIAWVTGSSRGMGRVIARHLAAQGARVVVHGTTPTSSRAFDEADSLDEVAQLMAAETGADVRAVHGDLTDDARVAELAASIERDVGPIDVLVNCAGGDIGAGGTTGPDGGKPEGNDAVNISIADLRAVLDRNLMACILPCRAVAPAMMARRTGRIINIGSISGLAGGGARVLALPSRAAATLRRLRQRRRARSDGDAAVRGDTPARRGPRRQGRHADPLRLARGHRRRRLVPRGPCLVICDGGRCFGRRRRASSGRRRETLVARERGCLAP